MTLDLKKKDKNSEMKKNVITGFLFAAIGYVPMFLYCIYLIIAKEITSENQIPLAIIFGKSLTSIGLSAIGVTYLWKNKIDEWDWWGLMVIGAIISVICLLWDIDISKVKSIF